LKELLTLGCNDTSELVDGRGWRGSGGGVLSVGVFVV
jgi:hypothetical protein